MNTVTEHKNPIEQALDVFVFAPLGFLLSARQTIPELAEKGRQYASAAKMMGEFAIGQGRDQAGKAVRQAGDQASQTLSVVSNLSGRRPATSTRALRAPEAPTAPAAPEPPAPTPPVSETAGTGSMTVRPTAQTLA